MELLFALTFNSVLFVLEGNGEIIGEFELRIDE